MKILWQSRLQNRLRDIGENVLIMGDHAFYAGDNDEQKQMKLRKFSLASGEQLAGAPFCDFTRAATFDDDGRTLVVLGFVDTIYKFNAADLALISKHKKGVLKYGNFIVLSSKGGDKKAITATDDTLFIYDFETQTGMRKRLKGCAAIFKQDELNFLIFTRSGQIYGLNLSGCELKIITKTCPMTQAQRVEGGYCIRVGEASENGEIESANELVFTDANFNVKFRVKLDFDFDRFQFAADGPDGWRGYFINEPNELRVLNLMRRKRAALSTAAWATSGAVSTTAWANLRTIKPRNLDATKRTNLIAAARINLHGTRRANPDAKRWINLSATSPLNLNSVSRSNTSRQSPCWRINLNKRAREF